MTNYTNDLYIKNFLRFIELGWHILTLVLLTSAFSSIWLDTGDPQLLNVIIRLTWMMLISTVSIIGLHLQELKTAIKEGYRLWLFIGLSLLSILWSWNPFLSWQAFLLLVLLTLYGCLLALRYPFLLVLHLVGCAMAIIAASSILSIMIGWEWAFMKEVYRGAWQGVMHHKNLLGNISAMAFIVFVYIAQQKHQIRSLVWWLLAGIAITLIFGSRSVTAIIALICAFITWLSIKGLALVSSDDRFRLMALVSCFVVPFGLLCILYWPEITLSLGRRPDLSGRAYLWQSLIAIGFSQPLLGNGYGTFDAIRGSPSTIDIALMQMRFPWAVHAHNGYIEVWLELGIVGLICILWPVFYLFSYSSSRILANKLRFGENDFFVLYLSFWLAINFTESLLINTKLFSGYFWVIFSWMYFFVITKKDC